MATCGFEPPRPEYRNFAGNWRKTSAANRAALPLVMGKIGNRFIHPFESFPFLASVMPICIGTRKYRRRYSKR